jgi:hypothetical protein
MARFAPSLCIRRRVANIARFFSQGDLT